VRIFQACLAALPPLLLFAAEGCQPAARYPAARATSKASARTLTPSRALAPEDTWREATPPAGDIPIEFVSAATRWTEWRELPSFWNHSHIPPADLATAHLGHPPIGAVLTLLALDRADVIKVKVPLGLPDPTPLIPAVNPPTYAKWRLGKQIFFDPDLLPAVDGRACAACHNPLTGFTVHAPAPANTLLMRPPSLINCAFNEHQFWDSRATTLEEVVTHDLEGDAAGSHRPRHAWPGLVARLRQSKEYREHFAQVFGLQHPTLDAAAQALATYLRTILAGGSLYDGAVLAGGFEAPNIRQLFNEALMEKLDRKDTPPAVVARDLMYGYRLFHGAAGCARCHGGPLFTDGGFHNIGIRESDYLPRRGEESGRFHALPVGLKEARLIGAFRTPTLRNLPQIWPYFHDGQAATPEGVVQYFNRGLDARLNEHLDPALLSGPRTARRLNLHDDDVRNLVLFLTALDGDPVPPIVARP
jgi:cytochrome c peroxidase